MLWKSDFWRLFGPTAVMSVLLGGLCITGAVYFYDQQARSTDVLYENIASRKAASNLEESLRDLIAMRHSNVEFVEPIIDRIQNHLTDIRKYADKPFERELSSLLSANFDRFLAARDVGAANDSKLALSILENQVLPLSQQLRQYNAQQIEISGAEHRQTLAALAWGLGGVGVVASLAGLVLGYGVSRGLRRSIHQLHIRVRDAADKLGTDLPPVVLSGGSLDEVHERMQEVIAQIEQMVRTLQQRDRELLRADQLAAVGQLAAGVAHEVRNPLTSIKMLVQAGRASDDSIAAEDLEIIEQEVRRIEGSLQTFLDFARPPRLQRARHDLRPIIDRVVSLVRLRALRQHVKIEWDSPDHPIIAEVDADQLQQVIVNVVLNALDVMPSSGRLSLRLENGPGAVPTITVRDSGPGIPAEILPRLFEPFLSSKETGLGLGLVVSKRIVEEHSGTLRGGNQPEGGAVFVIRLPPTSTAA